MSIFPKWLIVDFRQKVDILLSLIFFEKDLHMILNNVLNGKKGFLDYKNVILKKCQMVHFS